MSQEELQNNSDKALNEAVSRIANIFVDFLDEIEVEKKQDVDPVSEDIKS